MGIFQKVEVGDVWVLGEERPWDNTYAIIEDKSGKWVRYRFSTKDGKPYGSSSTTTAFTFKSIWNLKQTQ